MVRFFRYHQTAMP